MGRFPKTHGITLAGGIACIENLVVESLVADPAIVKAGRLWYNSTEKTYKLSRVDKLGALETFTLGGSEDLIDYVDEFKDLLSSKVIGEGSALIGYPGKTDTNGLAVVPSSTVSVALDTVIELIGGTKKDLADFVESSTTALANEVERAGLAEVANTEAITTLDTKVDTNFLNKTTDVQQVIEAVVKFNKDIIVSGKIQFDGDVTLLQKEIIKLSDNVITLNADATGTPTENAGLEVHRGDEGDLEFLVWDETDQCVKISSYDAEADDGSRILKEVSTAEELHAVRDALVQALTDLEAELRGEFGDLADLVTTAKDNLVVAINEVKTQSNATDVKLDKAVIGAGLSETGEYVVPTESNYIDASTSVADAVTLLDGAAKDNADAIAAENSRAVGAEEAVDAKVTDEITRATTKENLLGSSIDLVEASTGLTVDGAYVAKTESNYINSSTSIDGSVVLLDTAIKTVDDRAVAAEDALGVRVTELEEDVGGATGDLADLVTTTKENLVAAINEVKVQSNATDDNLISEDENTSGSSIVGYDGHNGTKGLFSITSGKVDDAIDSIVTKIDSEAKDVDDYIIATDLKIDTMKTSAGLAVDGTYVIKTDTNYLNTSSSLDGAVVLLDTAVKTSDDRAVAAEGAISTRVTGLETYVGTNIGDLTTLTTEAKDDLVVAINEVDANADSAQSDATAALTKVDVIEASAGLSEDGAYVASTGSNYVVTATTLKEADDLLDAQIKINADDIAAEKARAELTEGTKLSKSGDSMSGVLNMSDNIISGVADPVNDKDAVNKIYADSIAAGINFKQAVRVATTEEITLLGVQTIDEIVVEVGDRVLVKDQVDTTKNGIYVVSNSVWTRALDFDDDLDVEVEKGDAVMALEGTKFSTVGFVLVGTDNDGTEGIQVGTDPLMFTQFRGTSDLVFGTGITKNGNEVSLTLGAGIEESAESGLIVSLKENGGLSYTLDEEDAISADSKIEVKLDSDTLTISAAGLKVSDSVISDRVAAETVLANQIDAVEASTGLTVDGAYVTKTESNYIDASTSIDSAVVLLDTAVKTADDRAVAAESALGVRVTELEEDVGGATGDLADLVTTTKENLVSAINEVKVQSNATDVELTKTQVSVGLNDDGTYTIPESSNYLGTALSIKNSLIVLDSKIKTNEDDLATETERAGIAETANKDAIDVVEASTGLSAAGEYVVSETSEYISTATSVHASTVALDAALKGTVDSLASEAVDSSGSEKVGYDGKVGVQGNFSVLAGTVAESLDAIVEKVDTTVAEAAALKTAINNNKFTITTTSALNHTIVHNLNSEFVDVSYWIKEDSSWQNGICGVTIVDNNTLEFTLTEAKELKIMVEAIRDLV